MTSFPDYKNEIRKTLEENISEASHFLDYIEHSFLVLLKYFNTKEIIEAMDEIRKWCYNNDVVVITDSIGSKFLKGSHMKIVFKSSESVEMFKDHWSKNKGKGNLSRFSNISESTDEVIEHLNTKIMALKKDIETTKNDLIFFIHEKTSDDLHSNIREMKDNLHQWCFDNDVPCLVEDKTVWSGTYITIRFKEEEHSVRFKMSCIGEN